MVSSVASIASIASIASTVPSISSIPVASIAGLGGNNSEEDDGESNLRKKDFLKFPSRSELLEADLTRSFMLSGVASVLD